MQTSIALHKPIIFTDLDGCLLAKADYSFHMAIPLLQKISQNHIPLIINSSKTHAEIVKIKQQLQVDSPHIIENGAAIYFEKKHLNTMAGLDKNELIATPSAWIKAFSVQRDSILDIARRIKQQYRFNFTGFSEMTIEQITQLTNLPPDDAYAASQREFSEPLIWQDSPSQLQKFICLLSKHDISLQKGGRFFHLSSDCSKGKAMQWLLDLWQTHNSALTSPFYSIAMGDSHNDVSMLERSDIAIIIKNDANPLDVQGKWQTIISNAPATSGWVNSLEPLIDQYINRMGVS